MVKDHDCPSCGGANPIVLGIGEFECQYCHTSFKDEEMMQRKHASDQQNAKLQQEKMQQQREMMSGAFNTANKISKRTFLFVGIFLVIIFTFIGFMTYRSMQQQEKMQKEMQDDIRENINNNVNQHLKDSGIDPDQ